MCIRDRDNTAAVVFLHPLERFLPFFLHVMAGGQQFFPCLVGCLGYLLSRDLEFLFKYFCQTASKNFLVGKGHKRIEETDLFCLKGLYVIFYILSVGGDNGTVVVLSLIHI